MKAFCVLERFFFLVRWQPDKLRVCRLPFMTDLHNVGEIMWDYFISSKIYTKDVWQRKYLAFTAFLCQTGHKHTKSTLF